MLVTSTSVSDTQRFGRSLGEVARAGDCVALVGDLGAGKTHLVQAVAAGLGVPTSVRVTSPTFTLVNIYRGGRLVLVHADLYRLERELELPELGLEDWIGADDAIVCVEWADKFGALPRDTLEIRLEVISENERTLDVKAPGPQAQALLDRLSATLG